MDLATPTSPDASLPLHWQHLLMDTPEFEQRLSWLLNYNITLINKAIEVLDHSYHTLQADPTTVAAEDRFLACQMTFEWAEKVKLFALLLRDSLFEQQKAFLLWKDELVKETRLETLWQETLKLIEEGLEQLKSPQGLNNTKQVEQILAKRKHQQNPWPVYKKQLETIATQCKDLDQTHHQLVEVQTFFGETEILIQNTIQSCAKALSLNRVHIQAVEEQLNPNEEEEQKPQYVHSKLLKIANSIQTIDYLGSFKSKIEELWARQKKTLQPVVKIDEGMLIQRDFNPYKQLFQWLDSEVYPLLFEIWELTERGSSGLRMILVNLSNRLDLVYKDNPQQLYQDSTVLLKPLKGFERDLDQTDENLQSMTHLLENRLSDEFKLAYLYDLQRQFLAVSLQSTINQKFWARQTGWLAQVQHWTKQLTRRFFAVKAKWREAQRLSVSEKIVSCIKSRQADEQNAHYTGIFLTNGYVGDSFIVGREVELKRFEILVNNWRQGFRGSVLMTGHRFAGKTVFAEIVARKFFGNQFSRLLPNTTLSIQGRKLQTTIDLKAALDFVTKHNNYQPQLIVIDDLELWWSEEVPFYQNVQALIECIDLYSNRIFFVVTANTKMRDQLFYFSHAQRSFQAEINLDNLSKEAMQQAISIRHGATHKNLVDAKGEQLAAQTFARLVRKIHKASKGNIGEALTRWANSTYYIDEQTVENRFASYSALPNFINEDSAMILDIFLLHKRTNEYQLVQLLGHGFSSRYATIVRRLINTGVLKRQLDDYIEIEPTLVNDLQELIE